MTDKYRPTDEQLAKLAKYLPVECAIALHPLGVSSYMMHISVSEEKNEKRETAAIWVTIFKDASKQVRTQASPVRGLHQLRLLIRLLGYVQRTDEILRETQPANAVPAAATAKRHDQVERSAGRACNGMYHDFQGAYRECTAGEGCGLANCKGPGPHGGY